MNVMSVGEGILRNTTFLLTRLGTPDSRTLSAKNVVKGSHVKWILPAM